MNKVNFKQGEHFRFYPEKLYCNLNYLDGKSDIYLRVIYLNSKV